MREHKNWLIDSCSRMSGTKYEETYVQGANILGLGRNNLVKVSVDTNCRMDLEKLETELKVSLTIMK